MDNNLYDKKGIPILPCDTIKIYHYTDPCRREKRYMYKFVYKVELKGQKTTPLLKIQHLGLPANQFYYNLMDNSIMKDVEIVQGYGGVKEAGQDFRDRPRKKL